MLKTGLLFILSFLIFACGENKKAKPTVQRTQSSPSIDVHSQRIVFPENPSNKNETNESLQTDDSTVDNGVDTTNEVTNLQTSKPTPAIKDRRNFKKGTYPPVDSLDTVNESRERPKETENQSIVSSARHINPEKDPESESTPIKKKLEKQTQTGPDNTRAAQQSLKSDDYESILTKPKKNLRLKIPNFTTKVNRKLEQEFAKIDDFQERYLLRLIKSNELQCENNRDCHKSVGGLFVLNSFVKNDNNDYNIDLKKCSATLIADNIVLTNKHCLSDLFEQKKTSCDKGIYFFMPEVKENNKTYSKQVVDCDAIIDYSPYEIKNDYHNNVPDWALLRLKKTILNRASRIEQNIVNFKQKVNVYSVYFNSLGLEEKKQNIFGVIKKNQCEWDNYSEVNSQFTFDGGALFTLNNCMIKPIQGNSGSGVFTNQGHLISAMSFIINNEFKIGGTNLECINYFNENPTHFCEFNSFNEFSFISFKNEWDWNFLQLEKKSLIKKIYQFAKPYQSFVNWKLNRDQSLFETSYFDSLSKINERHKNYLNLAFNTFTFPLIPKCIKANSPNKMTLPLVYNYHQKNLESPAEPNTLAQVVLPLLAEKQDNQSYLLTLFKDESKVIGNTDTLARDAKECLINRDNKKWQEECQKHDVFLESSDWLYFSQKTLLSYQNSASMFMLRQFTNHLQLEVPMCH